MTFSRAVESSTALLDDAHPEELDNRDTHSRSASGRGKQRRETEENMFDKGNLLSGCDEFGTRIRIFTATLTGEREAMAHLGKVRPKPEHCLHTTLLSHPLAPCDVPVRLHGPHDPGGRRIAIGCDAD